MRRLALVGLLAGCGQLFGLDSPQLSIDAAITRDATSHDAADVNARSCTDQWVAGLKLATPAPLGGVNTTGGEHNPFVTADGNTLYFVRDADIFVAQRNGTTFEAPAVEPILTSISNDGKVWVSADRLTAFYSSNRAGGEGGRDIWRGYRANADDEWMLDEMYLENIDDGSQQSDPHVSTDLLRLYFAPKTATQRIAVASRTSAAASFAPVAPVENLSTPLTAGDDYDPTLSADELVIVFASTRSGSKDLWYATRSSASAKFAAPISLGAINTGNAEENPHLSSDGCTLYFSSDRGGNADLYMASLID
jgi:hypothetical protein